MELRGEIRSPEINSMYLEKAEILVEALPYIQQFNRKVIVIKYGGSAMIDEELKQNVIEDVVLLKLVGFKPVIVHGGGKDINKWLSLKGKEPEFKNGLRVTDKETMEIAEMVLGKVNKELVTKVQSLGVKAIGVSGKDGGMIKVNKKEIEDGDLGFVGDIKHVDAKVINDMLKNDYLPIISPIGLDDDYHTYNINADEAASAIAIALGAEKLAYLSDVEGVRYDADDPDSIIGQIYTDETEKLIEEGIISGGMIPKLRNCTDAIKRGVNRVHIMDGRVPHSLLLEIFTKKGVGTLILKED